MILKISFSISNFLYFELVTICFDSQGGAGDTWNRLVNYPEIKCVKNLEFSWNKNVYFLWAIRAAF